MIGQKDIPKYHIWATGLGAATEAELYRTELYFRYERYAVRPELMKRQRKNHEQETLDLEEGTIKQTSHEEKMASFMERPRNSEAMLEIFEAGCRSCHSRRDNLIRSTSVQWVHGGCYTLPVYLTKYYLKNYFLLNWVSSISSDQVPHVIKHPINLVSIFCIKSRREIHTAL